ncbi:glycosyltransferase family 1 protein [Moorena sp. SIO3I6]|uniref:glycosyltransferase family 1 protein n=1 Tax=Moorena sp. SIO3I6 TaxID=2607831 RepID=UPI0013F971D2|nr:glycosyltransferase family 1 protein [Moorena sp. SIO3I6]NEO44551.1 glycosyltransferase family 4 protein [Moorena sp. SIO4A3]NEP25911.1 glycosyltransferase family 4 protein [Moorena sp. SIO3I6]
MNEIPVISIVPRLPPAIDGVGDYAFNLAQQLRKDFRIETHFLVCDPTWTGTTQIQGFPISQVNVHSADTLLSRLPRDPTATVLLHYVGYGYAKRGCPVWLVDGLQRWRNASIHRTLVTMFHEVYASGPFWTSTFWLSLLQRNLAVRLVQLSDRVLTSKQLYAEILYQLGQGKHNQILTLPVFSNIGEPEQVPSLAKRNRRLVVFGGRNSRLRVYKNSITELSHTCKLLGIEEILDVGPPTCLTLSSVNNVPIVEKGKLSAIEISDILLHSLVGFFDYPTDFLAKSTIFAAYCAHGLLPVSARCTRLPVDGIEPRKHYWIPDARGTGLKNVEEMQLIANNAHAWYQTHSLSVQAKTFSTNLVKHS